MRIVARARFSIGSCICCFFVFILFIFATHSEAQLASDVARKAFPSVVLIVIEDANGQALSLGSGFFIQDGTIATNLHVIKGGKKGYIRIFGQENRHDIAGIVGINEKQDIALLSVQATAPQMNIGDSEKISIGDTVYAIGNPQGLEGTFSQGIISGIRNFKDGKILQLTAPISPGSSGGPILDSIGDVIGIAVASYRDGQNLNFAIPSLYLKNLLASPRNLFSLNSISSIQHKNINNDLGGASTEGVIGEQFLWNGEMFEYGDFTITLRNKLRSPVSKVYCLVIFYGSNGNPLETTVIEYNEVIPSGLAKRVSGRVDNSIRRLTTAPQEFPYGSLSKQVPFTKIGIRILDFKVDE